MRTRTGTGIRVQTHVRKELADENVAEVETSDFPEEIDWYLVGGSLITASSTTKGRKLMDNEIVHFGFSSFGSKYHRQGIIRFSTKRFGEVSFIAISFFIGVLDFFKYKKRFNFFYLFILYYNWARVLMSYKLIVYSLFI